jgi:23S rRNA (cytosine1962-C5)-methyltransferase
MDWPNATWVQVRAGRFEGYGLWDKSSPIAIRMFSRSVIPDRSWFTARVREAAALRRSLESADTNAYRLLYGEGDGVPGITVDVYDRYAVVVTYASALDALVPELCDVLMQELPLAGILRRERAHSAEESARTSLLIGESPPEQLLVRENGVKLVANLYHGQKTGLFLDHRDNRAYVRGISAGKRVLNLFSYTGAFSVYAALGGATHVTSVDVAGKAVAAATRNFSENGLSPDVHEPVVADVFEYLERGRAEGLRFDLVICDPPSFAGSQSGRHAAVRAYVRVNALGLSLVSPGGFYAAASCTAQVSPEQFRQALAEAAERARVRFQIVHDVGQAADHPVFAGHPEGRYLKFVVGRILPLA